MLSLLAVLPLAAALMVDQTVLAEPGEVRSIPRIDASALGNLPVIEFPVDGDASFTLREFGNPHHPCLTAPQWVIALHSHKQVEISDDCMISSGRWTGLFSGRTIAASGQVTLLPTIPAHLAMAAGLADRPNDLKRWQAPGREEAWLWIPVRSEIASHRAGRSIEDWKPARPDLACLYADRWLAAKVLFRLAVRPEEKAVILAILADCGRIPH